MNLAQLRTSLKAILNRNDCTDDLANTFISQAQTRIERTLRVPGMEAANVTTGNTGVSTNQVFMPADFLSLKHMYTPDNFGGTVLMEFKDLASFFRLQKQHGDGATPRWYTRVGASYSICPALPPGNPLTLVYYATQSSLVVDNDTNFFSIATPDLLLYCALGFAADYFVDDRAQSFEMRYQGIYNEVEEQGRMTDADQSSQAISPAYPMEY